MPRALSCCATWGKSYNLLEPQLSSTTNSGQGRFYKIFWYSPLITFSVLQRMTRLLVLAKQMRVSLVNQPPAAAVYWLLFPHQALYGHTQAVTCLAASVTYSVFVSGSDDRTCIIWDLNQLTYINQLPAHRASLSSVAINNSTVRSSFIIFPVMHP